MNRYHFPATIRMVDNSRANDPKHDQHAMEVTFKTNYEARHFAKTLFDKHGISSFTFPGKQKTAQTKSVFLTKDDLAKLSVDTKIINNPISGKLAYKIKATAFEKEKVALQTNSRHSNGFGPSS